MFIRVGYDIGFTAPAPTPILLMLSIHPSRVPSLVEPERPRIDPALPVNLFTDGFGNRCGRIAAPAGALRLQEHAIVEDSGLPDAVDPTAEQLPIQDLPDNVLQYLLASRYCEVDLLSDMAFDLFGTVPLGFARVQAVCDWVHSHVTFGYEHARPTRTAREVTIDRKGVCRDFQHLAIALCRCLHIPARYATGYLGDIGVPPSSSPMDFSAWFEAFLGGRWHTFDARHNAPRIGRVLMAVGRDATDVALTTSFGTLDLDHFTVWTGEVPDPHLSRDPDEVLDSAEAHLAIA